jgi:hypothetical protein
VRKASSSFLGFSAVVALFAYFYNQKVGLISFHPYDTSIVWEGGYRVWLGQVPFRDFFSPVGPVIFWALGLFFKLFGVSYKSFVSFASIQNAIMAACTIAIVRRWGGGERRALGAGIITAFWGSPIAVAIPWYNTFAATGLWVVLWLITAPPRWLRSDAAAGIAGLLVAIVFYTKQQYGAMAGVFFALYFVSVKRWREAVFFCVLCAAGLVFALAGFIAVGGQENVIRYMFLVPATSDQAQAIGHPAVVLAGLALGCLFLRWLPKRDWAMWLFAAGLGGLVFNMPFTEVYHFAPLLALWVIRDAQARLLLIALTVIQFGSGVGSFGNRYQFWFYNGAIWFLAFAGVRAWWDENNKKVSALMGGKSALRPELIEWCAFGVLVLTGLRYGLLSRISTGVLNVSALGSIAALGGLSLGGYFFYAALRMRGRSAEKKRAALITGTLASAALVLGFAGAAHTKRSYERKKEHAAKGLVMEHDLRTLTIPGLEGLEVEADQAEHLAAVTAYLKNLPEDKRPFYMFREYMVLQAIAGQPSPQPFVWLDRSVTYQPGGIDETRFCGALQDNGVKTIIVRAADPAEAMSVMPCLADWVNRDFHLERKIENFNIYSWTI